jgi:transposase
MGCRKLTLTEKTKKMIVFREKNKTKAISEHLGITIRTVQ